MFHKLFANSSEGDSSATIVGHLPKWIESDTFLYNGPIGVWDLENVSYRHWFDGQAMIQAFRVDLANDVVHHRKRLLRSDSLRKALANGRPVVTEYGTPGSDDPEKSVVRRVVDAIVPGEMTDNCACKIYKMGGLTVAATETALIRIIDPVTLETGDKIDLSNLANVMSARAQVDPFDSSWLYNLACSFTSGGIKFHFLRFPTCASSENPATIAKSGEIVATLSSRLRTSFSYYHTFGVTSEHLLMVEQPWVANSMKLLGSKVQKLSFKDCLEWLPDEKNKFRVVSKATGVEKKDVVYLSKEPFFFLNHVNSYEDGQGNLIADLLVYDSPEILDQLYLDNLRSNKLSIRDKGRVVRFTLPLDVEKQEEKTIWLTAREICGDRGCECPIVNPRVAGRKYRFAYVVGWMETNGVFAHSVTKIDVEGGGGSDVLVAWRGDDFQHPSEAIFVPGGGDAEDDGVIVTAVTDTRESEKDFLLFLDPRNMSEIARANFDTKIPFGGHGTLWK